MDNIERQLRKLESMFSDNKISWKTIHGKKCEAFPSELFDPDPELKRDILNADIRTCNTPGSLLEFVQMFLSSEKEYEEEDVRTAKMLADLGVEFYLPDENENE